MSNKLNGRQSPSISRNNVDKDRVEKLPSWLDSFASNFEKMEKEAVHSRKDDHGLYDQINTIIGGKSRYSTVSEAVKDYQEKTGLKEYLNNIQASESKENTEKTVVANVRQDNEPELFKIPGLKDKIIEFVQERHGHTSIPVVIDYIGKLYQKEGISKEIQDDALKLFINRTITKEKMQHPINDESHSGSLSSLRENIDLDPSNEDALHACMPAKG